MYISPVFSCWVTNSCGGTRQVAIKLDITRRLASSNVIDQAIYAAVVFRFNLLTIDVL